MTGFGGIAGVLFLFLSGMSHGVRDAIADLALGFRIHAILAAIARMSSSLQNDFTVLKRVLTTTHLLSVFHQAIARVIRLCPFTPV
jgi:hypothetical protein